jgi:hypothetical protein
MYPQIGRESDIMNNAIISNIERDTIDTGSTSG